jgi:YidC/Oxa1 family membrane protein insertase
MEQRRFLIFIVLAALIWGVSLWLAPKPQRPAKPEAAPEAPAGKTVAEAQKEPAKTAADQGKPAEKPTDAKAEKELPEPQKVQAVEIGQADKGLPARWVTLGSADENDPYRMLVTLTTRGAAVERIELSSSRYNDQEDRGGYLGHVAPDESAIDPQDRGKGCRVKVVGAGTPAAEARSIGDFAVADAGLKGATWLKQVDGWVEQPGDLITAVDGETVTSPAVLAKIMSHKKPRQTIELTVDRAGKELKFQTKLRWRPLEVIKPEAEDPLSLRLTLAQLDDLKISPPKEIADVVEVGSEIEGLNLWTGNWELLESDQSHAKFRRRIDDKSGSGVLEIVKTYQLAVVPEANQADRNYPAYHLELGIEISNISSEKHTVAYQLDGPSGLPTAGAWYATKVSRSGTDAGGMRDLVVHWKDTTTPIMVNCTTIANAEKVERPWENQALDFIGIDTQFIAVAVLPKTEQMFYQVHPLRVGEVNPSRKDLTDTSFRIRANPEELAPNQGSIRHDYLVFAGPKRPDLLAREHAPLEELVYYGLWIYTFFAKPLSMILHFFYACVHNYGLAIIMLTVLVRLCMFPMSRKQAISSQKMQQIQPELKKLQEKFKKDLQARNKAQQELYRKYNFNPFSGCLVMFVQLPIFIGLYRALSVDVELFQAPLIAESVRWCSNLAAPDMFYNWSWLWNSLGIGWMNEGYGMFKLGPYLNVLPIATIVLFILQQKMFMPPPADEQAALQQKMMKYMMIFMGVLFFKVASGLCLYFIASSLWGLAERKFLPKTVPSSGGSPPESRADAKAAQRAVAAKRDGAAAREKNKKRGKWRDFR